MWLTYNAGKTVPVRKQGPGRENQNVKKASKSALGQSRKAETQTWGLTYERTPGYRTKAAAHRWQPE